MKRSSPPKRKTPLRRKRSKPRRSERVRDPGYVELIRAMPCAVAHIGGCMGRIEADHAGERPLGRKADDTTCIPLCSKHHRDRTDYRGYFQSFNAVSMRAWCDGMVALYRDWFGVKAF